MRLRLCVLVLVLLPLSAQSARDPAEDAYQDARRFYYALKSDPARRKFRDNWLKVASKFEAVASRHPKSPRAPDALFTAAELMEDLSRISRLDEDLQAAMADYDKLQTNHPRHKLSDDAALALGRINAERIGKPEVARKLLARALDQMPKADCASKMRALLTSLGPEAAVVASQSASSGASAASASVRTAGTNAKKAGAQLTSAARNHAVHGEEEGQVEPSRGTASSGSIAQVIARGSQPPAEPVKTESPAPSVRVVVLGPAPTPTGPGPIAAPTPSLEPSRRAAVAITSKPPEPNDVTVAAPTPTDVRGTRRTDESTVRRGEPAPTVAVAPPPAAVQPDEEEDEEPQRPAPVASAATQKDRLKAVARPLNHAEVTLAEQLGLKMRRVVIDAGHGGHDSGAVGKGGTMEKDVTLAISKKLSTILTAAGLEVQLVRDDDRFVRLEDRAKFANEHKGDLFISVHCNSAASKKLHGVETYTLNTSSDRYSIRLAARENSSSEKGISDLQFILADLATKANTEESTRLATRVQKGLTGTLSGKYKDIRDLGTKEALFVVLLGAKMPAILVETAFLSNAEEEKRLGSKEYQEDVAQAIAAGVQDFLGNRQRLAKVD